MDRLQNRHRMLKRSVSKVCCRKPLPVPSMNSKQTTQLLGFRPSGKSSDPRIGSSGGSGSCAIQPFRGGQQVVSRAQAEPVERVVAASGGGIQTIDSSARRARGPLSKELAERGIASDASRNYDASAKWFASANSFHGERADSRSWAEPDHEDRATRVET